MKKMVTTLCLMFISSTVLAGVISSPSDIGIIFVGESTRAQIDSNSLVNENLSQRVLTFNGQANPFGTTSFVSPGSVVSLEGNITMYSKANYLSSDKKMILKQNTSVRVLSYEVSIITGQVAAVVEIVK